MRSIVLAAFLAVISVGLSVAAPDPHAKPPIPALPTGPLQLFAGNQHGAHFIVLDETKVTGTAVDAWVFMVPKGIPSDPTPKKKIIQNMEHLIFDCAKRDVFVMLSVSGFNAAGERVVWLPRDDPQPIVPQSMEDFLAQVICDHHPLPPSNTVIGHDAAIIGANLAFKYKE